MYKVFTITYISTYTHTHTYTPVHTHTHTHLYVFQTRNNIMEGIRKVFLIASLCGSFILSHAGRAHSNGYAGRHLVYPGVSVSVSVCIFDFLFFSTLSHCMHIILIYVFIYPHLYVLCICLPIKKSHVD